MLVGVAVDTAPEHGTGTFAPSASLRRRASPTSTMETFAPVSTMKGNGPCPSIHTPAKISEVDDDCLSTRIGMTKERLVSAFLESGRPLGHPGGKTGIGRVATKGLKDGRGAGAWFRFLDVDIVERVEEQDVVTITRRRAHNSIISRSSTLFFDAIPCKRITRLMVFRGGHDILGLSVRRLTLWRLGAPPGSLRAGRRRIRSGKRR
jgi:hypothetical protein